MFLMKRKDDKCILFEVNNLYKNKIVIEYDNSLSEYFEANSYFGVKIKKEYTLYEASKETKDIILEHISLFNDFSNKNNNDQHTKTLGFGAKSCEIHGGKIYVNVNSSFHFAEPNKLRPFSVFFNDFIIEKLIFKLSVMPFITESGISSGLELKITYHDGTEKIINNCYIQRIRDSLAKPKIDQTLNNESIEIDIEMMTLTRREHPIFIDINIINENVSTDDIILASVDNNIYVSTNMKSNNKKTVDYISDYYARYNENKGDMYYIKDIKFVNHTFKNSFSYITIFTDKNDKRDKITTNAITNHNNSYGMSKGNIILDYKADYNNFLYNLNHIRHYNSSLNELFLFLHNQSKTKNNIEWILLCNGTGAKISTVSKFLNLLKDDREDIKNVDTINLFHDYFLFKRDGKDEIVFGVVSDDNNKSINLLNYQISNNNDRNSLTYSFIFLGVSRQKSNQK